MLDRPKRKKNNLSLWIILLAVLIGIIWYLNKLENGG